MASAPVARAAGLDVLVQLLGEMEAFEDELDGGGDCGRLGGAELDDGAAQRRKLAELLDVLIGAMASETWRLAPALNAATTSSSSGWPKRRPKTLWTAFWTSRPSSFSSLPSPTDSSSILPTVDAASAPRSLTRGTANSSRSRIARLSALARMFS